MIIDHTHPLYSKKRKTSRYDKYNGAYYYSKEIVKNIIPRVKTDRNWITIRLPELNANLDHSIIFIHNNRNPNLYSYIKNFNDVILICSTPETAHNMTFFGTSVYLPLSVDVKQVEKYQCRIKDKTFGFAGRRSKINNHIPSWCDIITDIPRYKMLQEISRYHNLFAVGRTAIEGKILGCKILPYDDRYPDPSRWQILDNKDAAKILQNQLDRIDN